MAGTAIVVAALLLGQPPVPLPSDPLWIACETGEPAARIAGCARIAGDTAFPLNARSWALVLRAAAHFDAGDPEAALPDLDRAIRMDDGNWVAHRLRGDIRLENGDLVAALVDLDRAVELAPGASLNFVSRAAYFRVSGDYERARQDIESAIFLAPQLPDPYFERGRIALGVGDTEQALLDFQKYGELQPGDPATDFQSGARLSRRGKAFGGRRGDRSVYPRHA